MSPKEDKIVFHTSYLLTDSNHVPIFVSDEFVINALNDFTITKIIKDFSFLKQSKEAINNIHDPSVIDTIYTFSNSKNKIHIYRAKQKDLLITFNVTDPRFKLTGDVYPGMQKDAFYQIFLNTGYFGSNHASHFGVLVPVISVLLVPLFRF